MNIPYVFKKCSKCGRWLVTSTINFYRDKTGKYGLKYMCKECDKQKSKKYREEHKEELVEKRKKYIEENKEKIAQQQKQYYEKNREIKTQKQRQYYQKNRERILQEHQEYFQNNKKERAAYQKQWKKTPAGIACKFNETVRRRQRKEQQGDGVTKEQWLEMMKYFDWKCAYSGIPLKKGNNMTIDHIEPLVKGGAHEIWNCVPMDRSLNSSKCDSNMEEWYPQQDFYNEDRLNKIYKWCKYVYNKWGKK